MGCVTRAGRSRGSTNTYQPKKSPSNAVGAMARQEDGTVMLRATKHLEALRDRPFAALRVTGRESARVTTEEAPAKLGVYQQRLSWTCFRLSVQETLDN